MKILAWSILAAAAAAASACATRNTAICCTDAADCSSVGLPTGSRCEPGNACDANTHLCVSAECTTDADCSTTGRPHCGDGVCFECDETHPCSSAAPVCTADTTCGGCTTNADCAEFTTTPICGSGGACTACTEGETRCNADGNVVTCGGGMESVIETCTAGCMDAPSPHCAYLQPRFLPDVCDIPATEDAHWTSTKLLSTDDNSSTGCNGGIVPQPGGAPICVMHFKSLIVDAGVNVRPTSLANMNRPALALVTDDLLDLSGKIDSSTTGLASFTSGTSPSSNAVSGTGAAGATSGGGGCAGTTILPGPPAVDGPLTTSILRGGAGGGGGAILLISCRGKVKVAGEIAANGAGGAAGITIGGQTYGGGGGSAGGTVVMQGMSIEITGSLWANGGSGAAGDQGSSADGVTGLEAHLAAPGGISPTGGTGGDGGVDQVPPHGGQCTSHPGGGGGSVGFFVGMTPAGASNTISPMYASPPMSPIAPATLR